MAKELVFNHCYFCKASRNNNKFKGVETTLEYRRIWQGSDSLFERRDDCWSFIMECF